LQLLRQVVSRPKERLWTYPRLGPPFKTHLYRHLEQQVGNIEYLESTFKFTYRASSELGEWCADTVWTYALAERELVKLQGDLNRTVRLNLEGGGVSPQLDCLKENLSSASDYVAAYPIRSPDDANLLSPKVRLLKEELTVFFSNSIESKCIVFAKQRHTARLLYELFNHLDLVNLRPGLLIGVRSGDQGGSYTSLRQQFLTISMFRKGELNCLVFSPDQITLRKLG
jgi:endoribonuclease Dicer